MTDTTLRAIQKVTDSVRSVYTDCAEELELLNEFDPGLVKEINRELDSLQSQLYIARLNSQISALETERVVKQFQES